MQTRHNCAACRLAKCLAIGMSSHLIRKEEDHKKSKTSSATIPKTTEQIISTQPSVRIKQ
jgi:hypothetical protein